MEEKELLYLLSQMFKMDLQNKVKIVNNSIKLQISQDQAIKICINKI